MGSTFQSVRNRRVLTCITILYRQLFHRHTRAYYVYNGCLAWYNVVLTHGSTQAWNAGASL